MFNKNKNSNSKSARGVLRTSHNYNFWMSIILVLLAILIGTHLHDPILHGAIIYMNGWQLGSVQTGLLTGSTEAIISVASMNDIPTLSLFIFFMAPAIFIFLLVYILTIKSTSRFILIIGIILLGLNIASFSPSITGSDASKALELLILRGMSTIEAYTLMYAIFILALFLWGIYIFIATENDYKDARKRLNYVLGNK